MTFNEQTYSVLVVSSNPKLNDALTGILPYSDYYPVCFVTSIARAQREILARHYDFVIVSAPLPDDFGTRFAIDCCAKPDTVVLLLLRPDAYNEQDAKCSQYGIFTLQMPVPASTFQQGLKWMAASRERLRKMESKAATLEEKMAEIRLVTRAKCLLMEHLKMAEVDAHHFIERQAMDRCVSKKEVALGIINTYS